MTLRDILILATGTWWVILSYGGNEPRTAAGPYPSKALCQAAMHDLLPDDERFMTPAQFAAHVEQVKREKAAADAKWNADVAAAIAKMPPPKTGTINIPYGDHCSTSRKVENGKLVDDQRGILSVTCWGFSTEPIRPVAVTPCTFAT